MIRKKSFGDFVDKKKRESIRQLKILAKLLEFNGMKVDAFVESSEDPYIYCFNPSRNGSFDGIRIYKIGDRIAFRIQKENETHPYGSAYPIPVEEMFQDFLTDEGVNEQEAGKKVIESIYKEVKKFFEKSMEIEKENRASMIDKSSNSDKGNVIVKSSGTDYSALVYNKG